MQINNEMAKDQYLKAIKKLEREKWENVFVHQVDAEEGIFYIREYRFHPVRKWSFDFILADKFKDQKAFEAFVNSGREFVSQKCVAVELEGGTYTRGRHTRGVGFAKDCEKRNFATSMGWKVFNFPSKTVEDGSAIKFLREEVWK